MKTKYTIKDHKITFVIIFYVSHIYKRNRKNQADS